MSIATARDTEYAAALTEWGETLTLGASAYACASCSLRGSELRALPTEMRDSYQVTVALRRASITSAPAVGDKVTYRSKTLRVLRVYESQDRVELRLDLGTEF